MFKRKNREDEDRHTEDWTLNRIWYLFGLLIFEIFCIVWLIIFEQQLIFSFVFMAFAVASILGIIKYCRNYRRKFFIKQIDRDLKEDQKFAKKYGATYYIWKTLTLPTITFGKKVINDEKLLEKYVNLELEKEELEQKINFLENELEKLKEKNNV